MPFSSHTRRLRPSFLALLLLGSATIAPARTRPPYALPGHEKPVAFLHAGKATYLVTEHSVLRLEGKQFVRKQQLTSPIQCAAVRADTAIWLGTRTGVQSVNTTSFRTHSLALPGPDAAPSITAVFRDARGAMWVGANGQGVFRWANNAFSQELHTPAINGGVATADSSVWIATSIGLSRKQGAEWTRYNEEGVANHEIPDNIVEKLLPDNAGNLWVIMSDAICVFENGGQRGAAEEELPTVKFIGRPGNEVTGVATLAGVGRLFATAQGLLLLPNEPAGFASFAAATDKVEPKRLLMPVALPTSVGNPVLLEVDKQQRLWLMSAGGVTVLTGKELRQLATSPPALLSKKEGAPVLSKRNPD
jgi:ligand-binding sensor domain-containing protein